MIEPEGPPQMLLLDVGLPGPNICEPMHFVHYKLIALDYTFTKQTKTIVILLCIKDSACLHGSTISISNL